MNKKGSQGFYDLRRDFRKERGRNPTNVESQILRNTGRLNAIGYVQRVETTVSMTADTTASTANWGNSPWRFPDHDTLPAPTTPLGDSRIRRALRRMGV